MYILFAVLLLIVVIFGVSSGMQSYATAQQAQATIEVAQVAQVNAWGNLVTILTVVLLIVVVIALVAAALWMMYSRQRAAISGQRPTPYDRALARPVPPAPPMNLDTLIQLEMVRMLRSLNPPAPSAGSTSLPVPHEEDEELHWLR